MDKKIIFSSEAREELLKGVNKLADAVCYIRSIRT